MKKTFETPDKAVAWALSYLHCSNAEIVIFKINEDKIEEHFIGKKNKGLKLISLHRGYYACVTTSGVELKNETGPFEYGLCLN